MQGCQTNTHVFVWYASSIKKTAVRRFFLWVVLYKALLNESKLTLQIPVLYKTLLRNTGCCFFNNPGNCFGV